MSDKLNDEQRKEWAKSLFLRGDSNPKVIAEIVEVPESALREWIKAGMWDEMRKSLLATRSAQLSMLYGQLDTLNRERMAALHDDNPKAKPDTDGMLKIAKAINLLEAKTGIGEMVETGMDFITFVQGIDFADAKFIHGYYDRFIKTRLKTIS